MAKASLKPTLETHESHGMTFKNQLKTNSKRGNIGIKGLIFGFLLLLFGVGDALREATRWQYDVECTEFCGRRRRQCFLILSLFSIILEWVPLCDNFQKAFFFGQSIILFWPKVDLSYPKQMLKTGIYICALNNTQLFKKSILILSCSSKESSLLNSKRFCVF